MSPEPSPRAPRISLMLVAHVFRMDASEPEAHRVVNLSTTGACVVADGSLEPGSTVVLTIGQVEHVAADVLWSRGGLAGLRFHRDIVVERARMRRTGAEITPPASGWLVELNDPYSEHRRAHADGRAARRTGTIASESARR